MVKNIKVTVDPALARKQLCRGAEAAGTPRPSLPTSVFAEDFSLLIRTPRRMRIRGERITVLH